METKVKEVLARGAKRLRGFDNPRLEAEILLMHVLKWDRIRLYANLDEEVPGGRVKSFIDLIKKRSQHTPSAYLTNSKSFYGLDLYVDSNVLIPRPETEALVGRAGILIDRYGYKKVYDVGTGCGNIATALAKKSSNIKVVASDIERSALKVAKRNAENYKVSSRIEFVHANLGEHIQKADLVVANLPYVPRFQKLSLDVACEPGPAVFDPAKDGLGLYKKMFEQSWTGKFNGHVLIELRPAQYPIMQKWLKNKFSRIKISPIKDISGATVGLEADFH